MQQEVGIVFVTRGEKEAQQAVDRLGRSTDNLGDRIVKGAQVAQRLERQYKLLDRAFNKNKISAQNYAKAIQALDKRIEQAYLGNLEYEKSILRTGNAHRQASAYTAQTARRTNQLGVLFQQTGYQVGDFAVQVQSGTNVMVALGQQATQLVGTFGMLARSTGAIAFFAALGIAVPIVTALAGAMMRVEGSSKIFDEMAYALEPIKPLIEAIAIGMSAVADISIDFANLIVNNLDRIVVVATTAAVLFAGKWVASFVAARVATLSLVGALTALKGALIRTGIGAIVVAAGELVYQFTRLVKGAGGFGNAVTLLGGVVSDFFDKAMRSGSLLAEYLGDMWIPMEAGMKTALANMLSAWGKFVSTISSGMIKIPFLRDAGLDLAFEAGTIGQDVDKLKGQADSLRESWGLLSGSIVSSAKEIWSEPSESMNKLREAMKNADEEGRNIDIRDWFGGTGATEEGEGGGGDSATDRTKDAMTELQERVQSVADTIKDSMSDAFMSMVEGTKSAKDAFRDMARAIIKQLFEVLVVQQLVGSFNATTGEGSGIVGAIMGAFQANGGVWNKGSQVEAFANGGIVGGPTVFPMANGKTGLMGEAGPEAIMPLKRGKNGKLGVQVEGSQQPVVINQSFNFQANGDDSVKRIIAQEAPKIAQMTQKQVLDQRARGGAFRTTFGA